MLSALTRTSSGLVCISVSATEASQVYGRGEPSAALRHHGDLDGYHGQPRPSSPQPDHALQGLTHNRYAGTDDRRGTGQSLTQNVSR